MNFIINWIFGKLLDELFTSKTDHLIKESIRISQFGTLQNRQMTVAGILDTMRLNLRKKKHLMVNIPLVEDHGYVIRSGTVEDFLNTAEAFLISSYETLEAISSDIESKQVLPDNFNKLIPAIKKNQGRAINIIDELNKCTL